MLNYQQGGLLVYVNDDLFTRLDNVAIWNTRQTEFGKEMPYAGRTSNGGTIVGPPGETTYLRIVHHFDAANNEHELRAWTMREGGSWVMGGVWTLPGDEQLQVGPGVPGPAGAATGRPRCSTTSVPTPTDAGSERGGELLGDPCPLVGPVHHDVDADVAQRLAEDVAPVPIVRRDLVVHAGVHRQYAGQAPVARP